MPCTSAKITFCAAFALVLGGCTIKRYGYVPPPPAPPANAPRNPASTAEPPAGKKPATGRVITSPKVGRRGPIDNAPPVTSPIVFGNGTGGAFRGQAYVIPDDTTKLPDFTNMVPFATLFTDSFDVRSQEFTGGFPGALVQEDWFAIRYEGNITVPREAAVEFKVISDDGAVLYIDGAKVVDNDGKHTAKTATGKANLKVGVHQLRLEYFQAAKGTVALQVYTVENGKDALLVGTK